MRNFENMIQQNYGPHEAPDFFSFPVIARPKVSLIIPVYNKYEMTKECLYSILQHTSGVDYEVVVADDCSMDQTSRIGELIGGIKHIRMAKNGGFGANVANAIDHSAGEYIALLNNDMLFYSGWLNLVLDKLENDPRIGAAGGTLLAPDGTVSELGGMINEKFQVARIGSRCRYRKELAVLSDANFDYKSGCYLIFKRSLWDKVGGFDENLRPAYGEDADLCLRIKKLGFKIANVFDAKIMHFETVTYRDIESRPDFPNHTPYLIAKWGEFLAQPEHQRYFYDVAENYYHYLLQTKRHLPYYKMRRHDRRDIFVFGHKLYTYPNKVRV